MYLTTEIEYLVNTMIFSNNQDMDIDLDVENGIIVDEFLIFDTHAQQIRSWEKPAINVVGKNVEEARKILQSEGFEQMGDIDPY